MKLSLCKTQVCLLALDNRVMPSTIYINDKYLTYLGTSQIDILVLFTFINFEIHLLYIDEA